MICCDSIDNWVVSNAEMLVLAAAICFPTAVWSVAVVKACVCREHYLYDAC